MSEKAIFATPADLKLQSRRCLSRQPHESDAAAIVSAVLDVRYPSTDLLTLVRSEDAALQRIKRQQEAWAKATAFSFSVFLIGSTDLLGQVSLSREPEPNTWLLAYWVAPRYWGRGIATEAVAAVIDFARHGLSARSIWAGTTPGNVRSQRSC